MPRRLAYGSALAFLLVLALSEPVVPAQPHHDKIWNYDGGLQVMMEGSFPAGPCFRINGRATAPGYFDNLKRVDTLVETYIHRGPEVITEFPAQLHLSFVLYDFPCEGPLRNVGTPNYLTNPLVETLRLRFYWKHGMALRPASGVVPSHSEIRRVMPFLTEYKEGFPERFEWEFEFDVPSVGVPVTDSLVFIFRTPDGRIAARGAARL